MASLFLLRLTIISFIATLTNFFFLFLRLPVFAITFWRLHRHIFRSGGRWCRFFRLSFLSGRLIFSNRLFCFRSFSRSVCTGLRRLRSRNIRNIRNIRNGPYLRLLNLLLFLQCSRDLSFRLRCRLFALYVGATFAHLYIHGFGLTGLQRGSSFSLQSNLARLSVCLTVGLSQIGQQLLLLIAGYSVAF